MTQVSFFISSLHFVFIFSMIMEYVFDVFLSIYIFFECASDIFFFFSFVYLRILFVFKSCAA